LIDLKYEKYDPFKKLWFVAPIDIDCYEWCYKEDLYQIIPYIKLYDWVSWGFYLTFFMIECI